MLDTLLSLAEKVAPVVFRRVRVPLHGQVMWFCYDDRTPRAYDSVVVITPYPRRYLAEMRLTNRTEIPVFIAKALVILNDRLVMKSHHDELIRVEPHETIERQFCFPLESEDCAIEAGQYSIRIEPVLGRATIVSGRFPIREE